MKWALLHLTCWCLLVRHVAAVSNEVIPSSVGVLIVIRNVKVAILTHARLLRSTSYISSAIFLSLIGIGNLFSIQRADNISDQMQAIDIDGHAILRLWEVLPNQIFDDLFIVLLEYIGLFFVLQPILVYIGAWSSHFESVSHPWNQFVRGHLGERRVGTASNVLGIILFCCIDVLDCVRVVPILIGSSEDLVLADFHLIVLCIAKRRQHSQIIETVLLWRSAVRNISLVIAVIKFKIDLFKITEVVVLLTWPLDLIIGDSL